MPDSAAVDADLVRRGRLWRKPGRRATSRWILTVTGLTRGKEAQMAKGSRGTTALAGVVAIEGAVMMVAGGLAWLTVRRELAGARITVEGDADMLAGRKVTGPFSAYAEARVIDKHTLELTGGKTFAELDGDDPNRQTAMSASFMRASLFTSVMAFGVAALAMGLGLATVVLALIVRSASKR